jgi:hypothetical protein
MNCPMRLGLSTTTCPQQLREQNLVKVVFVLYDSEPSRSPSRKSPIFLLVILTYFLINRKNPIRERVVWDLLTHETRYYRMVLEISRLRVYRRKVDSLRRPHVFYDQSLVIPAIAFRKRLTLFNAEVVKFPRTCEPVTKWSTA